MDRAERAKEEPHAGALDAARAALRPGDVHVWRLHAAAVPGGAGAAPSLFDVHHAFDGRVLGVLDGGETVRAARLTGAAAVSFIVTRAALRRIFGGYLGTPPAALRFTYAPTGKPLLAEAEQAGLSFSVTHTAGLSLIAVAALRRVGIDAEPLRPRLRAAAIARRVFAPGTGALLARLAGDELTRAFHHAWTLREAHVKALGSGVFASPDTLPLEWPVEGGPRVREERTATGGRRRWTVAPLEPASGYVATLVVEGVAAAVHEYDAAGLFAPVG